MEKTELVCCKCHACFQTWQRIAVFLHGLFCDGELIEQPKIER